MRNDSPLARIPLTARSLGGAALAALLLLSGCERLFQRGWLDQSELVPSEIQRQGLVVPILKEVDPADLAVTPFSQAEDVRAEDLKPIAADYRIGANDLVQVSIFEAQVAGQEATRNLRVSESGMISVLGLREPVKVAGLTEPEAQQFIAQKLVEQKILVNPQVTVIVAEARQRTFSIMGAVARPGQYAIYDTNFRLLDALVLGQQSRSDAEDLYVRPEYVYIVRKISSEKAATQPAGPTAPPATRTVDPLAPRGDAGLTRPVLAGVAPAPLAAPADDEGKYVYIDGKARPATTMAAATGPAKAPADRASDDKAQPAFEFGAVKADPDTRVIRVPALLLRRGDLRYNIVVRAGDLIIVPAGEMGEYFMGGHVQRPGAYSLTQRQLTLKQAIISAGMLDPLGVPERAYLVRRVQVGGEVAEVFVRMDLAMIFAGQSPDVFLKPYDQVLVGTNAAAPFLNALRGAFRMSYGLGFLYDRNFAYDRTGTLR